MRRWGHFLLLFLLFGGLGVLWSWRGGQTAYFLLIATAVLLLQAVGTALLSLRGVSVECGTERSRVYGGEALAVSLRIQRRPLWPVLWLLVQHTWQHSGGARVTYRELLFPWMRADLALRYRMQGLKRGEYKSAGVELYTGDLFGLMQVKRQRAGQASFLVYPQPVETGAEWSAPYEEDAVASRSASWRDSGVIRGVRPYEAGDPLSRIHWKLTARSGGLKTKTFEPAGTERAVLWLDTSAASYSGSHVFEAAVQAVAGMVRQSLGPGSGWVQLRSSSSEASPLVVSTLEELQSAYEWLARIQPDGRTAFGDHLLRESLRLPLQLPLVLVTPLAGDAFTPVLRRLRHAGRACTVLHVHGSPALTWPQRQWKRELEELGCRFADIRAGGPATASVGEAEANGGAVDGIA